MSPKSAWPLDVPDDRVVWDRLGIEPKPIEGDEPWVRELLIHSDDGRDLTVFYDPQAGSVAVFVHEEGNLLIHIEREHAIRFLPTDDAPPSIRVDFRSDDSIGSLVIRWSPSVQIEDNNLEG